MSSANDASKYRSVGEWYAAHRGRVPIQTAWALDRVMQADGISFPEAYRRLVERRRIIEIPQEPPAPPASTRSKVRSKKGGVD